MNKKEKDIQRALGLLERYLVKVEDISKKPLNIIVEAVSIEDARAKAMMKLNSKQRKNVRKSEVAGMPVVSVHQVKLWEAIMKFSHVPLTSIGDAHVIQVTGSYE